MLTKTEVSKVVTELKSAQLIVRTLKRKIENIRNSVYNDTGGTGKDWAQFDERSTEAHRRCEAYFTWTEKCASITTGTFSGPESWLEFEPGTKPVFTNEAEAEAYFNLAAALKYAPKVLQLRGVKDLVVTRYVGAKTGGWTLERELELQRIMAQVRRASNRGLGEGSDAGCDIRSMRALRNAGTKVKTTIVFERGGYSRSLTKTGPTLKDIANTYHDLRKEISHARCKLRAPVLGGGHFGDRAGKVYLKPGRVLSTLKERERNKVREDKAPESSIPHVGVELEFCSVQPSSEIIDAFLAAGLDKQVAIKSDGSLRVSVPGDRTHEITILATEKNYQKTIADVCAVLGSLKAYVNKSCGMHVHLDMRRRDPEVSYHRLIKSLPMLYRMTPPERWYNKYCARNALDMPFSPTSESRYWAINASAYARHKTIEIRLHSGTLNALKINYWVQLLLCIVKTHNTTVHKTLVDFSKALHLPADLTAYMQLRIEKFEREGVDYEDGQVRKIYSEDAEIGKVCYCEGCLPTRREMRVAS